MDLSIIIVNWRSKAYLEKCVASIRAWKNDQIAYEIVVIDCGSYDGSREMLQQQYPCVRFIQSDKNLGFARANNEAFRVSRGDYIVFLNPDTEVVGPALSVMCDHMHRLPVPGAVGCKLLNSDALPLPHLGLHRGG